MAKKSKYEELASNIMALVGGNDNITSFVHCMTRLRFNVKDKGLVNVPEVEKLPGVVGTQWAENQLQIIIGQAVEDAYKLICQKSGLKNEGSIDENIDGGKKKFSIGDIFEAITASIVPLIPLFLGTGLIKVLVVIGNLSGIMPADSSTSIILTYASEAGLYFMPIFVAYASAKRFGVDISLAMGLASLLVFPSLVTAFGGETSFTIFGLPIYKANYANMMFPSIMIVFVMSYVERFFKKIMPEIIRVMMVPLCTLLVMIPLALCIIAPAGMLLGNGISWLVESIYNTVGFLGVGILAGLYPLLIITGMHSTLAPVCMSFFIKLGFDPLIIPACYIANFATGSAALAVSVKSKKTNIKGIASSSSLTAFLAGVTEPALFGVTLRYKTPLIATVIGGFVGGCYAGLMGTKLVAMSGLGLFALAGFLSGDAPMNFVHYVIATVISIVVTFVITFILYKDEVEA